MKCKKLLTKLKGPTRRCLICFNSIKNDSLFTSIHKEACLCSSCYKKLTPKFIKFDIDGIEGLSIYDYNEDIQALVYQYKGCFDIALSKIFLERFKREIRFMYRDYVFVPIPSYSEEDKLRGFNHVIEILNDLGIKPTFMFQKTSNFKQALHSQKERSEIKKHLKLANLESLENKNILIFDDIYTTGSTIRAAIELIKPLKPAKIKVLVIAKTIFKEPNTN